MTQVSQNIIVWEGTYFEIPFSVVDGTGAPVDITDVVFTYKLCDNGPDGVVRLTKTILSSEVVVVSASGGTGKVIFNGPDTTGMGGVTYYHELAVTDVLGHPEVGFIGTVTINKSAVL